MQIENSSWHTLYNTLVDDNNVPHVLTMMKRFKVFFLSVRVRVVTVAAASWLLFTYDATRPPVGRTTCSYHALLNGPWLV